MKVSCVWQTKMVFEGVAGEHRVKMDAKSPIGSDAAPTPKQLLLMAVCGCTSMDIIALLKKYKQDVASMAIEADADATDTHPQVFKQINLRVVLKGTIDPTRALEAVQLSQSKYCSVSAMVSKVSPIHYVVEVNGEECGRGVGTYDLP